MEKKKISLKEIGMPKLIMLFLAGILLIIITIPDILGKGGTGKKKEPDSKTVVVGNDTNTTSYDPNTYITDMENKLEDILRKVDEIGEVAVMITMKESKEQVALKDIPYTQEGLNEVDGEGGSRTDNSIKKEESTVLVNDEDGKTVPYIIKELEPEIEGVVVIAEGGDNIMIVKDVMEAVEVLFDVPAHKVKVMKMSKNG
ncbi:MAG TPA: stage III sporulation protein AG [Mobilitalea sp.]|nr:stage III sporulation protein AG [Mobilitalea sp.]